MTTIVADCPRCNVTNTTFDVLGNNNYRLEHDWQVSTEAYSICRNCKRGTILLVRLTEANLREHDSIKKNHQLRRLDENLNAYFEVRGWVSHKDTSAVQAPLHVPEAIGRAFTEASLCIATKCWNASAAMFRTCVDLATKTLLPDEDLDGLNHRMRTRLHDRLGWLFRTGRVPLDLKPLAECVKDYGNDGVHDADLTEIDARDLQDFTTVLLERLFTEPERVRLALVRREERKNQGS